MPPELEASPHGNNSRAMESSAHWCTAVKSGKSQLVR
jgi:hypothetical protein